MRIAIVGPGAMGNLFCYLLSRNPSQQIWLLDVQPERTARVRAEGLFIEGVSGEHHLRPEISLEPAEVGPVDLVLLCVKGPDTAAASLGARPLLGPQTAVLTLQNGMGNLEEIDRVLGRGRTLGGTTAMGATVLDLNRIRHAGWGETVIGEPDGEISPRAQMILDLFKACGLEVSFTRDLPGLLWSKLIVNVGINPLTALMGIHNGRLLEHAGSLAVMEAAVGEAARVAAALGIRLLYENPLAKVTAVCKATSGNVSSMLQDVLREKRTEIDQINGVVVREGARSGVPAPVNEMLVHLVGALQDSYAERIRPRARPQPDAGAG